MAIIEKLYQNKSIPTTAKKEVVKQILKILEDKLVSKLNYGYVWVAVCYNAVRAGEYGATRRINSRKKLLELINICRQFLEMPKLHLPTGWERINIISGHFPQQENKLDVSLVIDRIKGREKFVGCTSPGAYWSLTSSWKPEDDVYSMERE